MTNRFSPEHMTALKHKQKAMLDLVGDLLDNDALLILASCLAVTIHRMSKGDSLVKDLLFEIANNAAMTYPIEEKEK